MHTGDRGMTILGITFCFSCQGELERPTGITDKPEGNVTCVSRRGLNRAAWRPVTGPFRAETVSQRGKVACRAGDVEAARRKREREGCAEGENWSCK